MCECRKKPIKVDIELHSPHVTMKRKGDLIDLNYCGLNKVFNGEVIQDDYGTIKYKKGSIFRVSLGFAMRMPEGKKAEVYQRSGTRENFGVLLTNHVGQIDNAYNGSGDTWIAEFCAIQDGKMDLGDRVLQFEIVDVMPKVEINVVEKLGSTDRGGFGSTGV